MAASRSTSIKVTGNVTEAIAALDKLGVKVAEVGHETESKLGGAATKTGGFFSKLSSSLGNFGFPMSESLGKLGDKMNETETKGKKGFGALAEVGKAMATGLAGGLAVVGAESIKAAEAAQVVDAKLKTAIENVGGSMEEFDPKIKAADASMRSLGFTNNETNTALATLTTSLGSPSKALQAYKVAADLARAKSIDLNTASLMVAKAMEGQTRPLKALGIDLPVYAGGALNVKKAQDALAKAQDAVNAILTKTPGAINPASKAHASYESALAKVAAAHTKLAEVQSSGREIMTALTERVKGSADAYGHTLAGQTAAAKAQLDNLGERIGTWLMPKLEKMIEVVQSVTAWLGKHKDIAMALAGVIGGVVVAAIGAWVISLFSAEGAIGGVAVALAGADGPLAGFTTAMFGADAAMAPMLLTVGLVIAAIAALAVGAYELYKHWNTVWAGVKEVTKAVWDDGLKPVFDAVMHIAIAPLKDAVSVLATIWRTEFTVIRTVLSDVWNFMHPIFQAVVEFGIWTIRGEIQLLGQIWNTVWSGVKTTVSTVWGFLKPIFGFIVNTGIHVVRDEIQGMETVWNSVWSSVKTAVQDAWNFIQPIISSVTSGISDVVNAVSKVSSIAGDVGGFLSGSFLNSKGKPHANGGWTTGALGQVSPDWVHGGEYVLSNRMLAGQQPIDPAVAGILARNNNAPTPSGAFQGGGNVQNFNLTAMTTASSSDIAREMAWAVSHAGGT